MSRNVCIRRRAPRNGRRPPLAHGLLLKTDKLLPIRIDLPISTPGLAGGFIIENRFFRE